VPGHAEPVVEGSPLERDRAGAQQRLQRAAVECLIEGSTRRVVDVDRVGAPQQHPHLGLAVRARKGLKLHALIDRIVRNVDEEEAIHRIDADVQQRQQEGCGVRLVD
jgi:hypothetical protein